MMLLGMALYKAGVITGERDRAWYRRLALVCLPVGFALCAWGIRENFAHDWSFDVRSSPAAAPLTRPLRWPTHARPPSR